MNRCTWHAIFAPVDKLYVKQKSTSNRLIRFLRRRRDGVWRASGQRGKCSVRKNSHPSEWKTKANDENAKLALHSSTSYILLFIRYHCSACALNEMEEEKKQTAMQRFTCACGTCNVVCNARCHRETWRYLRAQTRLSLGIPETENLNRTRTAQSTDAADNRHSSCRHQTKETRDQTTGAMAFRSSKRTHK